MAYLNPYSKTVREMDKKAHEAGRKKRQEALDAKRGLSKSKTKEQKAQHKALKKGSDKWINNVHKHIDDSGARAFDEEKADAAQNRWVYN